MTDPLLRITDLAVSYRSRSGRRTAVDGVSLELGRGEVLALVGESGSGKTTIGQSVIGLLAPGGRIVIYGPFMRGGDLTSDGDIAFHASLQSENPAIGYKDDFDIMDLLQQAGLDMAQVVEMPANNLALIAEKPKT